MPTITVSAADSATAMDQIIAQLGEDAMILDTTTKDGKLEIRATNDVGFQPRKAKQVSDVFSRIMRDELNPPEAGDRAKAAATAATYANGARIDKAKADSFWKQVEDYDAPEDAEEIRQKEREAEINIQMRRLKWENERLERESHSLKDMSREFAATAKDYYEKSVRHGEETKETLNTFRDELKTIRGLVDDTRATLARNSRRRLAILAVIVLTGIAAGAYSMRDQGRVLLPWVDTLMSTIGATVNVSMEHFRISELEAVRRGDTIRVKGTVTNTYPLSADAPVIRFLVQDEEGKVLTEREVIMDQLALRPGQPMPVSAQLVLADRPDDDILTNIIAMPVAGSSPAPAKTRSGA